MAFNNPRINFIDKQADTCVNFTVQDSNLGDYRRFCTLEGFSDEKGVRIDGLLYGDFSSLRVENSIDLYDIGYEGITDLFFDNLKSLGLVDQNAELKLFVKEAEELKNIFYIIRSSFMAGREPYFFDGMLSTVFAHNQEKEFNSYLNAVAALYNSHISDFKCNASANCVDDPEERIDWIRNNTNFYDEVHSLSDAFIVKLMSCQYKRTDYAKNPLESQINYLGTIIKPVERYCKLDKEFFDNIKKFEKESKGRYMQAGFFGGHLISNSDRRRYQKECEDRIIEIEDIKKLYSDLLEYRKQASECICLSSDVDYYSKIEKTIEKKLSSIFSNRRQGYYYGIIAEQLSKKTHMG